jgi:hypothetical protein
VVIASLPPKMLMFEDSSLRVGMTVAMINDQKVWTAEEGTKTVQEAKSSSIFISVFRGVYEADRHSKLVSASIAKEMGATTKTGITLKRYHGILYVANISEGSPWSSTNLAKGMRIWARFLSLVGGGHTDDSRRSGLGHYSGGRFHILYHRGGTTEERSSPYPRSVLAVQYY